MNLDQRAAALKIFFAQAKEGLEPRCVHWWHSLCVEERVWQEGCLVFHFHENVQKIFLFLLWANLRFQAPRELSCWTYCTSSRQMSDWPCEGNQVWELVTANAMAYQSNIPPRRDQNSRFFTWCFTWREQGHWEQIFPIYAIKHCIVSIGISL